MQVQSEEDLSKYKKRGYEYVEDEKMVLDEIVMFYRKRLQIAHDYLKSLEQLHSTAKAAFDPAGTLYTPLVAPVLISLQRDIQGYKLYVQSTEEDLDMIIFATGPHPGGQDIKRDMEAVKPLYSDYEDSCAMASKLSAPSPSGENDWKVHEGDVRHRQIAARLHAQQNTARTHFETTYPKLLDDHMEYMEQVTKLVLSHTNYRSELSTTTACNANAEKERVHKFSTADAIAVPHMKMGLEKDRREYKHAPILNLSTRKMEDARTVILGRDIQSGSSKDPVQKVIMACLNRYAKVLEYGCGDTGWEYYWDIIHMIESDSSEQNVQEVISKLRNKIQIGTLICTIMFNTRMPRPLLDIVDERAMKRLSVDWWDRSALIDVMRHVDPEIREILKACAIAYHGASVSHYPIYPVLRTKRGSPSIVSMQEVLEIILRMWDFDSWRPLPDDVQWVGVKNCKGDMCLRKVKHFRARPGYHGGHWIYLEVDGNGRIVETTENQEWIRWVEDDKPAEKEQVKKQQKFRFTKLLQRLKL